jgi:polyisoprenoid-binding protein YceI
MSAVATEIPTTTWQADKIHSTISFAVKHMVVSTFRAGFSDYDAQLKTSEDGYALTGAVRAASVDIADETLRGHLGSPDFFDVERTPEIKFESTSFEVSDDGEAVVEGDLTIKDHTERVVARGTLHHIDADLAGGQRIGVELETTIDRTKYGLAWNAPLPKGGFALANDVTLRVHLELVPEA